MPPSLLSQAGAGCLRLFKWLPVVFITTIVAWSYYAYVVQLCFFTVEGIVQKIFYLIFYHAVFATFLWAYWQTIFTDVGTVPKKFKLPASEAEKLGKDISEDNQRRLLESFARDLPVSCRTMNGAIRYCEKCRHVKPDRAHHCSVCGLCVLKMDHHCPWVNNCVSFTNYKFFILFLGYALLYCLFVAATSTQYFVKFWTNNLEGLGRFHILFLFFLSMMFAISLISLFVYHCYLVSVNRSTLESFRHPIFRNGPDKDGFSMGFRENFFAVFGENKMFWFLPIYSSIGDGIVFPTRPHVGSSYNSMGKTAQPRVPQLHPSVLFHPESGGETNTFSQRILDDDTDGLLNQQQSWGTDEVYDDVQVSGHQSIAHHKPCAV